MKLRSDVFERLDLFCCTLTRALVSFLFGLLEPRNEVEPVVQTARTERRAPSGDGVQKTMARVTHRRHEGAGRALPVRSFFDLLVDEVAEVVIGRVRERPRPQT